MDAKEAAPPAAAPSHDERVAHGNSGFFKPRNVLNDIPFRGSRVFDRGGGERGKDHARPYHNNSADYVVPEKGNRGEKEAEQNDGFAHKHGPESRAALNLPEEKRQREYPKQDWIKEGADVIHGLYK
jgi:hypothetical protein